LDVQFMLGVGMIQEWEKQANKAASRWYGHELYADARSAAFSAAWHNRDEPVRVIKHLCKIAIIDEFRLLNGRPGSALYEGLQKTYTDEHGILTRVPMESADSIPPSLSYGLTGQLALIADRLSEGHHKCDIAAELGFHPSRVSQLIEKIQKVVRKTDGIS
jgi:hypothetical protein